LSHVGLGGYNSIDMKQDGWTNLASHTWPTSSAQGNRGLSVGALATAMHLMVLVHRVTHRGHEPVSPIVCIDCGSSGAPADSNTQTTQPAPRFVHAFHAGLLDRLTGVAVLALAAWLTIMHISGIVDR